MAWVSTVPTEAEGCVSPKQGRQGGGQVYRLHPAMVDAGSEGRSKKPQRNMPVIGPGAEMGGAAGGECLHLIGGRNHHDVPATVGAVAMGQQESPLRGRQTPRRQVPGVCRCARFQEWLPGEPAVAPEDWGERQP